MSESGKPLKAACPILYAFCEHLLGYAIKPPLAKPETVAAHFRHFIEVSHPFDMRQANAMIQVLGLSNVVLFHPRLKELTGNNRARGTWYVGGNDFAIYIRPIKKRSNGLPARPTGSIIHTLLHEIGEIILEISYAQIGSHIRLPLKRREWWANRFAGMCMMPPERFTGDAERFGLDLRQISHEYETSLASTSRQIRDAFLKGGFYYFCRCDIVADPMAECDDLPEKQREELLALVEKTDGYVVRVRDVVRNTVDPYRARRGDLPMYNLPGSRVYRVMSGALRDCAESGQPIFIDDIAGGASFENVYHDLFGFQDMSLLIIPYGYKRTHGFFLQAVDRETAHHLRTQAAILGTEAKYGVSWLFSQVEFATPHKKIKPAQKTLPLDNPRDTHLFTYPWITNDRVNWRTGTINPPVAGLDT